MVAELEDYTGNYAYKMEDLLLDKQELEFDDVNKGDAPVHQPGIPRVGHHAQGLAKGRQALQQPPHMGGAAQAVEPQGVDERAAVRRPQQRLHAFAAAGDAVRIGGKGYMNERIGARGLDPFRRLLNTGQGGQRFKQIAVCLLRGKARRQGQIFLRRPLLRGRGADIGEHQGFLPRRPPGDGRRGPRQGPLIRGIPGRLAHVGGEGVGFDGPAARLFVRPMDRGHLVRRGEAGPLHRPFRKAGQDAGIGAQRAGKQQHAPGQGFPNALPFHGFSFPL